MSDILFNDRPMCDFKGCERVSNFHGFERDVCWSCYARLLENGGFYSLTQEYRESTIESNPAHLESPQLSLFR